MLFFFGGEAHGILAPQLGIKPIPTALEGRILTTGPPGKSREVFFQSYLICNNCRAPWDVKGISKRPL